MGDVMQATDARGYRRDPDSAATVAQYAARWLSLLRHRVHARTAAHYERQLRLHVLPVLGPVPLRDLRRVQVRHALEALREEGLAKRTVQHVQTALTLCLEGAIQDGLVEHNVARGAGRRIFPPHRRGWGRRRAMTREQLAQFLRVAPVATSHLADLFETLAGAGLRIGEALGLEPQHVNVARSRLHIVQEWTKRTVDEPKHGSAGEVEIPRSLAARLDARATALREVGTLGTRWLFPGSVKEQPWDAGTVARRMKDVLAAAELPLHFTPHSFRHTYATLLLEETRELLYVQRQLRHASIQTTIDCYGQSAHPSRLDALERLDSLLHGRERGRGVPVVDDAREVPRDRDTNPC
jgi:integrase